MAILSVELENSRVSFKSTRITQLFNYSVITVEIFQLTERNFTVTVTVTWYFSVTVIVS